MSDSPINDQWIVSKRGSKNLTDPRKAYGWLIEKERTSTGKIEDTGIIFLTNMECPFHCLMCDLWKNTTDKPVAIGSIPKQIVRALKQMPGIKHIKLYNSGSFFDNRAIPAEDYKEIALILKDLETVIVESHPKFINENCLKFRDMLKPDLQIAVGLETVHPEILPKLNKKMTTEDFINSVTLLTKYGISSRAFILLRTPWMNESEGVIWAERSIDFAFDAGVESCTVIPVRVGNGAMELLMQKGEFNPPDIQSMEHVLEYGIGLQRGRVFADTWDLSLFSKCEKCTGNRTSRLVEMNLTQQIVPKVECECGTSQGPPAARQPAPSTQQH